MLGVDTDHGGEFINTRMIALGTEWGIPFTRSLQNKRITIRISLQNKD
jgi:hypothetical protein